MQLEDIWAADALSIMIEQSKAARVHVQKLEYYTEEREMQRRGWDGICTLVFAWLNSVICH